MNREPFGVVDTCVYVDAASLDPTVLPVRPLLTAVTIAELSQGVAMARTAVERAARAQRLATALAHYEPLPFDGAAATRYGQLVDLVVAAGRDPRPRRMELMIAATAASAGLALSTSNPHDFRGLDSAVRIVGV